MCSVGLNLSWLELSLRQYIYLEEERKIRYVIARKINPKKEEMKTPGNFEKGPLD